MRSKGLTSFDVIVTSPFRRCLQTAGLIAKALSNNDGGGDVGGDGGDGGGSGGSGGSGGPRLVVDNRLGEYLLAARRTWASASIDPPGDYTYVSVAEAARWAGVAEGDLLWDRDANQVLIEAEDDLGQRIQSMQSICDDAIARVGAAGPLDPGTLPSCASRTSRVLVVTHGDLINRFTPGFDFDPSIGRYCASECGWLACTGFAPLPAYDGDTVELSSVPRVLAVEGVETM